MDNMNNQTPYYNQHPAPVGNTPIRSIALCIILSLVTCGIYALVWFYQLNEDTRNLTRDYEGQTSGIALLLSIVTCGIYQLIWMYKQGEKIDRYKASRGIPGGSAGILYLVLSIFGLSIVSMALMQDELNKMPR
jgi:amino acid transporter